MASLHGFNSWAEIADYIDNTLHISYTDDPTSWVDAMKEEMEGYKFIKVVNDATGMVSEEIVPESLYEGVGEFHTGANYQGQTVSSGGGVKSAPTAKSIITENSGSSGGTAVITDEAIGVKDTGLTTFEAPINILSGIMQVYGLVHTGIEIANAQVWKDMSNYVYGTEFTENTPLEKVIDFLGMRITNCITDHWEAATGDQAIRMSVPESIAERLYAFMANHMIEEQTPGISPNTPWYLYYNFISRTIELYDPTVNTIERYKSVFANPTRTVDVNFLEIGDDLFKTAAADFVEQVIGTGYLVAASVATALIASMEGVWQFFKTQSVDDVENAQICSISLRVNRGSTPPPYTTPISLSEFEVNIRCVQDECYIISDSPVYGKRIETDCGHTPSFTAGYPRLADGYSYEQGDLAKYLKRGHSGDDDQNDYAYMVRLHTRAQQTGDVRRVWETRITYPSNEQALAYLQYTGTDSINSRLGVNGYGYSYWGFGDFYTQPLQQPKCLSRSYSNVGYKGTVTSYMPDDYLVTAGIRSKSDASGNPERHPEPGKTKEDIYPEFQQKKQNARPQAVTDPQTGVTSVVNKIDNYIPTAVPVGNTDRLINHGMNNTDDPESYTDNRPQHNKAEGRVNTNDPVDGWNEGADEAVDNYNDSKNDPNHYPDPIPANEPNPQYPTNPPSETTGENDDPTSPATLPGVTASGMVSVYNPTKAEVISFSSWLWTGNVFENIKKLLQDPMEAIIGMHIMYATPHTTSPSNIIVGWLDSGVAAKVVDQQYTQLNCGSVTVPEYYGDVLDYEPYVHVHMYLPFVGIVSLKPNDVIGKSVNVTYGIDALTGTCLAMITTTKGNSKIQCYTFPGNCAVQIPLTGGSYAQVIRGIASMAVGVAGSVATGNALGAVGGVIGGVMASHLDVSHSGNLGANAGAMGVKKPYIIITRKVAYDAAGYNQFYGYPANKTVTLGSCKGYTRVKSVHIESIPIATSDEKQMIETLLKQGVIIR